MTGPLAQQFAQLERCVSSIGHSYLVAGPCPGPCPRCEFDAALSVIERHVQEMERAMWEWLANDGYNDRDCDEIMEQIRRRAALSAGGEGSADRLDDHMAAARHGAALGGHAPRQADEALNALEVLRGVIRFEEDYEGADEAIATVRSELERLREERDSLADAQQFPVGTVMSWKRRADSAEAINRYARLLLDPDRQDEEDEENALRAFEALSGIPLSQPAELVLPERTLELIRDITERGIGPDTTPEEALKTIENLINKRHPREQP